MKNSIIFILLFAAAQANAQMLALYAGGGYAKDLFSKSVYQGGSLTSYKGGSGFYAELYASTTLKHHIELTAGIRTFLTKIETDYQLYGTNTTGNHIKFNPQVGVGYNRNAKLSIRAGLLIGYINGNKSTLIINNVAVSEGLKSTALVTPYASIGFRNIMLSAAYSYGLGNMIDGIKNTNAKMLTIGLIYRLPIIK